MFNQAVVCVTLPEGIGLDQCSVNYDPVLARLYNHITPDPTQIQSCQTQY